MGSMADYYIELGQNQGWDPIGRSRPIVRSQNAHDVTCKKCGARNLKWGETEHGWRLFSQERGVRNQKLEHQCASVGAADFEDLT